MDDFHVGPISSVDPYGQRRKSEAESRRRFRQPDRDGSWQEDSEDSFEPLHAGSEMDDSASEAIEDYYTPSDPKSDA